jgi:hypothetical protein
LLSRIAVVTIVNKDVFWKNKGRVGKTDQRKGRYSDASLVSMHKGTNDKVCPAMNLEKMAGVYRYSDQKTVARPADTEQIDNEEK